MQCIEHALNQNHLLCEDLKATHDWLRAVADCLRYPIHSPAPGDHTSINLSALSSQQIQRQMKELIYQFQPDPKRHPVQAAFVEKLRRSWRNYGSDLLHCYDISGLPPDNLHMEALFGRVRRHQRRISGRKSTIELQVFGHY